MQIAIILIQLPDTTMGLLCSRCGHASTAIAPADVASEDSKSKALHISLLRLKDVTIRRARSGRRRSAPASSVGDRGELVSGARWLREALAWASEPSPHSICPVGASSWARHPAAQTLVKMGCGGQICSAVPRVADRATRTLERLRKSSKAGHAPQERVGNIRRAR